MNDIAPLPYSLKQLLDDSKLLPIYQNLVINNLLSLAEFLDSQGQAMLILDKGELKSLPYQLDWLPLLSGLPIDPNIKASFLPTIKAHPLSLVRLHSTVLIPDDPTVYTLHDKVDNYLQLPQLLTVPTHSAITFTLSANNDTRLMLPLKVKFTQIPYLIAKEALSQHSIDPSNTKEFTLRQTTEFFNTPQVLKANFKTTTHEGISQLVCEVFNQRKHLIFKDIVNVVATNIVHSD